MSGRMKYPVELKIQVLKDYQEGGDGYRAVAVKYGLKRDTVRSWVKASQDRDIMQHLQAKAEREQSQLEKYKALAKKWEDYAHELEEKLKKLEKKG